jgi:hypothetical protein
MNKNKKDKNEKKEEYLTIHTVFKSLSQCSSVVLRNKLEARYPVLWANTGNDHHSDEKRIRRILDKLVDFGLATKEKIGKDQIYTYKHENNKLGKVHKLANELNVDFDDMDTYYKRRNSIISLLNDVSDVYYIQTQQEKIDKKENIIKDLELAIEKNLKAEIIYNSHHYRVAPIRIAQFDGFWYLIAYNEQYYSYRIKDISLLEMTQEIYPSEEHINLDLNEWLNAWHNPKKELTKVKLYLDKVALPFFQEKNILGVNTYKNRLTPCQDGAEYDLFISHEWELLPILMQWQKHVTIIDQDGDIDLVGIYQKILGDTLVRLSK